jgi:putative sterol carrier protein
MTPVLHVKNHVFIYLLYIFFFFFSSHQLLNMSDIKTAGFQSSEVFAALKQSVDALPADAKAKLLKQVNGIFEFVVMNADKKTETFTVDLKKQGAVVKGKGPNKADAIISISDADFVQLASGKLNGK